MQKAKFIREVTELVNAKKKIAIVTLMKRLWIKISLEEAKILVNQASIYNFEKNAPTFPKVIDGILYKSSGEYIYEKFNAEQKSAIKKSIY